MRLAVPVPLCVAEPGGVATWIVDVTHDGDVIEGVRLRVLDLDVTDVTVEPAELPLFPGDSGQLVLSVTLPSIFPAGRHVVLLETTSTVTGRVDRVAVSLDVQPASAALLQVEPRVQRAHRKATFRLTYHNTGNQPLSVLLSGADSDRTLRYSFAHDRALEEGHGRVEAPPEEGALGQVAATFAVEPGEVVSRLVTVRAKRRWTGGDNGRPFTVEAAALGLELEAPAELRQRPMVPRGVLTSLVLATVILLWAGAFLFGLKVAYRTDALTKTAPASFFLRPAQTQGLAAADLDAADLGTVPKSGPLAPGVGGGISGAVRAVTTGRAVGRIVVTAWRSTDAGLKSVTSAATQADGTYSLVGLFPGDYLLQFHAAGFRDVWFPSSHTSQGAAAVIASSGAVTSTIDVAIAGDLGSLTGTVDPGDTTATVPVTVRVSSLLDVDGGHPQTITATKQSDGLYHYSVAGLPTPDTYQISVTAPGYAPSLTSDQIDGGQDRSESAIELTAGDGTLSGTVVGPDGPLGGVIVSTTVAGVAVTTATPTAGSGVGTFTLANLTTPGTYVLSFTATGFAAPSKPVTLEPGQPAKVLTIRMTPSTNSVGGQVNDAAGHGIGNAVVTVGGVSGTLTTTTLTQSAGGFTAGHFSLAGLPSQGSFTLTVSAVGFANETVPLTLVSGHDPAPVRIVLQPGTGAITGHVLGPDGKPSVGATVTITTGAGSASTTTTDTAGDPAGRGAFGLNSLAPGTYTVTATKSGFGQQTAVVTVPAGGSTDLTLTIPAAS